MKIHTHMATFVLLVLSAFMLTPAHAYFFDGLSDVSNLSVTNVSSSTTILDDNSGSGIITFTRDTTATDTMVDWRESGTGFFDLSTETQFVVTPEITGTGNVGSYNVNLLFFNSSNTYVGEGQVIADTSSTAVQSIDVTSAATTFGNGSETQWYARIRLVNGPGQFSFDSIAAVPEPSTGLLVGLAMGAFLLSRRRFRA